MGSAYGGPASLLPVRASLIASYMPLSMFLLSSSVGFAMRNAARRGRAFPLGLS